MKATITGILAACAVLATGAAAQPLPSLAPQVEVFVNASRSFLGVGVAEITSARAKELKLKEEHGVEITQVEKESPAEKAGLKVGDVVLEYNGQRVEGTQQFIRLVRETPPGRQVRLLISRNGATQTVSATIGERKGPETFDEPRFREQMRKWQENLRDQMNDLRLELRIPDVPRPFMSWQSGSLGIEAESLNPQLAEFFGVKEGVLVRLVNKDSPAEKAGIRAGDVIIKIDGTQVSAPREITSAIRSLRDKETFPVTVVRNKKEMTLTVTIPRPPEPPGPPSPPARPRQVGSDVAL